VFIILVEGGKQYKGFEVNCGTVQLASISCISLLPSWFCHTWWFFHKHS